MRQRDVGGLGMMALLALAAVGAGAVDAAAQEPEVRQPERTIRVMGVGEVRVPPDQAQISFAVETFRETAQAAGAENARVMERVIAALVAAGIPRDDLETQNYSVYPEYIHEERGGEPRIRGYRAANQMVLTTGDLDRVGALIDIALGAGANRMNGVSFSVRDSDAATARALAQAVQRARVSAQAIASALGVGLGPVIEASTTTAPTPPVMRMERMDMAAGAATTPISPGDQTIQATVSLAYAMEGGG